MIRAGVLVLLLLVGASAPAAGEPARRLAVDYHPPYLSVEARGVDLWQVLEAIAAKVGFEIVELRPSGTVVTVSIRNKPVPEALEQILRTDDHAFVYAEGGASASASPKIERIVLWGQRVGAPSIARVEPSPSAPSGPSVTAPASSQGVASPRPDSPRVDSPVVPAFPSAPDPSTRLQPGASPAARDSQPTGQPDAPSASDMLTRHALSAMPTTSATTDMSKGAVAGSAKSSDRASAAVSSSGDMQSALAATTQAAQRDIRTLVDALARATQSLGQSSPAPKP